MHRRTRVLIATLLLLCAAFVAPAVACADDVLVERRIETVSGAQVALGVVEQVQTVAVGSQGATLTLETARGPQHIEIGVEELLTRTGDPLTGLALIALAGSVVFKGAAILSRMMR